MELVKKEMIESFMQGKEDTFVAIYNGCKDSLYCKAYFYLKNKQDAEDVVQETFIKMYRFRRQLKSQEAFYVWMYKILYNICKDKQKRKYPATLPLLYESYLNLADDVKMKSVEDSFSSYEISDAIARAITKLSPILQDVALLHFFEELSAHEIAMVLKLNVATVYKRIFRAKGEIKKELKQKDITPETFIAVVNPAALFLAFKLIVEQYKLPTASDTIIYENITKIAHTAPIGVAAFLSANLVRIIGGGIFVVVVSVGGMLYFHSDVEEAPKVEKLVLKEKVQHSVEPLSEIADVTWDKRFSNQATPIVIETTNDNYDYYIVDGVVNGSITRNGTLIVSLIKDEREISSKAIEVYHMDFRSPDYYNGSKVENMYSVMFQDDKSGVNINSIAIYCDGNPISFTFDQEKNILSFVIVNGSEHTGKVCDYANNCSSIQSYDK